MNIHHSRVRVRRQVGLLVSEKDQKELIAICDKVRELRFRLKIASQTEFGELFHLSQTRVSAIENAKERPSAEALAIMGNLCVARLNDSRAALEFWAMAGVDVQNAMLPAARSVLPPRMLKASEAPVIAVRSLAGGPDRYVDRNFIGSSEPDAVAYVDVVPTSERSGKGDAAEWAEWGRIAPAQLAAFVAEKAGLSVSAPYTPHELFLVDTSETELASSLNRIVLLQSDGPLPDNLNIPPAGLHLGRFEIELGFDKNGSPLFGVSLHLHSGMAATSGAGIQGFYRLMTCVPKLSAGDRKVISDGVGADGRSRKYEVYVKRMMKVLVDTLPLFQLPGRIVIRGKLLGRWRFEPGKE